LPPELSEGKQKRNEFEKETKNVWNQLFIFFVTLHFWKHRGHLRLDTHTHTHRFDTHTHSHTQIGYTHTLSLSLSLSLSLYLSIYLSISLSNTHTHTTDAIFIFGGKTAFDNIVQKYGHWWKSFKAYALMLQLDWIWDPILLKN